MSQRADHPLVFLGPLSAFKSGISGPITRSNETDATAWEREAGNVAATRLRELLGETTNAHLPFLEQTLF
jgi:hypothetical protein